MGITYAKQAQKFLKKTDTNTCNKIMKNIERVKENGRTVEKLIPCKKGMSDNLWRIKMEHYRVIFEPRKDDIHVMSITTKTNTKFRRTGCH